MNTPDKPRQDVQFSSQGTTCRGWLTLPPETTAPFPLVLMAHGFGATRDMHLEQYARRFNAAGFATLLFDYRGFGSSDGEPRNRVNPKDEIADWHAALRFVRALPGIDTQRIALWGTSFAGGLVISVAAEDRQVAATISQCPMLDGLASALEIARYAGPASLLRISAHGLYDLAREAVGLAPHYVPIVARPGDLGAMSSADAWDGYLKLVTPGFRNEVTARTALAVPFFRPVRDAARVACPALIQICEQDSVAPPAAAERAAARIKQAEVVRYPVGHFDVYFGADFERSVSDQLRFLQKHLGNRT